MLFFPYAITVAILATQLSSINAGKPPSVVIVPSSLNFAVPDCSRPCLDEFIRNNYPPTVCRDPTDIGCLCVKNTPSGFTIEEAAIRCAASSCWDVSEFPLSRLANICSHITNALPPTHSQLEVWFTPTAPPETQHPTTTSIFRTTRHPDPPITTVPQPTSTGSRTSSGNGGTGKTSSPTPDSSPEDEELSNPAIAGISIVGASAFILAGALLYLCLRRRRRKTTDAKGDIANEGEDNSPDLSPDPNPKSDALVLNNRGINRRPTPASTKLLPPPPAAINSPKSSSTPSRGGEIGVAIYPDYLESPASQSSRRTDSQLLPDKPNYSLYPEPLRVPNRDSPRRGSSATVFEEDVSERRTQAGPTAPGCSHGVGLPSDPRALMYAMERRNKYYPYGSTGVPAQQSNTALSMPSEGNYQNFVTMPTVLPPDHPHSRYTGSFVQSPTCSNRHCSSQARGSYQAPTSQDWPTCSHRAHLHSSTQRNTGDSFASNTTFGSHISDDEDDYDLPDRTSGVVTRLSPVQEASNSSHHTGHSPPLSANSVTYPKMPRSASVSQQAEAVHQPRAARLMKATSSSSQPPEDSQSPFLASPVQGPQQHQPQAADLYLCPQHSSSGSNSHSEGSTTSSLLAKRRGDTVADRMESSLGLSIPKSSPSKVVKPQGKWTVVEERCNKHNDNQGCSGATRVHKRDSLPSARASGGVTRFSNTCSSPQEEVSLTPTRKGHDLYLNVERR